MMRGRRDEAEPASTPTSARSSPARLGRAESQVPDYVTFYTQTEGREHGPGLRRLPRLRATPRWN